MTSHEIENSASNPRNKDDAVITSVVSLGVISGIGLLFLCIPPATSAFLFSMAGSAMLYRFLGGTSGNTFDIKGFKATASASILFAGTLGLNHLLENQVKNPNFTPRRCITFTPNSSTWVPLDRETGVPIEVQYSGGHGKLVDNIATDFSNHNLSLDKNREVSNGNFRLGRLKEEELRESISINLDLKDISFSTPTGNGNFEEFPDLPFKIKVLCTQNCSHPNKVDFQLQRQENNEVIGKTRRFIDSAASSEFQVFQLDNEWYFVTVAESCKGTSCESQAIRFLAGRITENTSFLE